MPNGIVLCGKDVQWPLARLLHALEEIQLIKASVDVVTGTLVPRHKALSV